MRPLSQLDNFQSKNSLDDPKVETIAELFRRRIGGGLGIVSTAFIADATPGLCKSFCLWTIFLILSSLIAALCAHTRDRKFRFVSIILWSTLIISVLIGGQAAIVVTEYLNSASAVNSTFHWPTSCEGPDVIFGQAPHFTSFGILPHYFAVVVQNNSSPAVVPLMELITTKPSKLRDTKLSTITLSSRLLATRIRPSASFLVGSDCYSLLALLIISPMTVSNM